MTTRRYYIRPAPHMGVNIWAVIRLHTNEKRPTPSRKPVAYQRSLNRAIEWAHAKCRAYQTLRKNWY